MSVFNDKKSRGSALSCDDNQHGFTVDDERRSPNRVSPLAQVAKRAFTLDERKAKNPDEALQREE